MPGLPTSTTPVLPPPASGGIASVVASDGLTDNLHTHEITAMIRKGPLPAVIDALISLAKRRMTVESTHQPSKPDDLSVILFRTPYKGRLPAQKTLLL